MNENFVWKRQIVTKDVYVDNIHKALDNCLKERVEFRERFWKGIEKRNNIIRDYKKLLTKLRSSP